MKSIELIVRIIIKRNNTFLFCKNKKRGNYYLIGGHVEFGDSLEETIYKEIKEEIGLKKENITNISYKTYFEQKFTQEEKVHHELNMIFTANIPDNIKIISKENHISFEWIDTKDIKNINLLPKKMIPLIVS
ncbi:MAG: NUDIX domain-containing protein [bacterium]